MKPRAHYDRAELLSLLIDRTPAVRMNEVEIVVACGDWTLAAPDPTLEAV
jgi:hypothetical protein